jgi:hypothetical protein
MSMKNLLDLAFFVSVSLVLIKLGDLVLRPHQERWLKDKLETLTLKLSYQKPVYRLFNYLSKPIVFWLTAFLIGGPVAHELGKPLFKITSQTDGLVYLALLVVSVPNFKKAADLTKSTVEYIAGKLEPVENYGFLNYLYRFTSVVIRYAFICIVISALVYLAFKAFLVFFRGQSWYYFDRDLARVAFIPMWPFIFFLYTIIVVGVLVIIASGLLFICHILLLIIRGTLWRVVEFNKGPFGAIIIIVTAVLGVIDAIVKLKK